MSENDDAVYDEICTLLQRYNRTGTALRPETDLNAELNIDSVAAMDLIMEIEDRYDIDIPINLVAELRTVRDLVQAVHSQRDAA